MAEEREGITVRSLQPVPQTGSVFYASLPRDTETSKGHATDGEEGKCRLVATLWDHLAAMGSPCWQRCQSSNSAALPIQMVRSPLGRPHLLLGEYQGPAVSFSEGGGKVWAALCGDESDIGIDVAGTDEFQREYPFHRVFQPQELEHALLLAGGDLAAASALLWSIKEAVVKAMGCAFHLVDPQQITVYPAVEGATGGDGGYTFPVGLSAKARERFPLVASRSLRVRSLPQRKSWLSIALLNRRPTGHE